MPLTIAADSLTSEEARFPVGLRYLVAASATFQTITGAASTAAALSYVHFDADDTSDSTETRPRAIIDLSQYEASRIALATFGHTGGVYLTFEFSPSSSYSANRDDALIEHLDRIGRIRREMQVLQGAGAGSTPFTGETYVSIGRMQLIVLPHRVDLVPGDASETVKAIYQSTYLVEWVG